MAAQLAPAASQRRHWYVRVCGVVPVHVPTIALSARPSRGVPEIDGRIVFAGGTAAICAVSALVPCAVPAGA